MLHRVIPVLVAWTLFANSSALLAQSDPGGRDSNFSLGLAVISSPRPYKGVDNERSVFPVLLWQKGGFYFRGIQGGYEWFRDSRFFLDVYGRPHFDGYEESDSDFLDGMSDRDASFDIGVGFGYRWDHVVLRLSTEADVIDNSDGGRNEVHVSFPFMVGRWILQPAIAGINLDDDWVNYYYGVEPDEGSVGRPVYVGESSTNLEVSFRAIYRKGMAWAFFGHFYGQSLGREIEDSPIVDGDSVGGAIVGFLYTF